MAEYPMRLLVHGGAGALAKAVSTPEKEAAHHRALQKALKAGYAILKAKGPSLDAVRESVKVLENSPLFNAGRGSALTQKGKVELDAAIMDGNTLKAGAVAGISRLKNPVLAADLILKNSKHLLLIGKHAENFAKRHGMAWIDPETLITAAQLKHWQELKQKKLLEFEKHGTVGAVALDAAGNLAAATSTGGIMNKAPGRVGDSPIIGAGTYADNESCAISATGQGEYFMRLVFAYDVAAQMRYRRVSLEEASMVAMRRLKVLGAKGGFIGLDRQGQMVMPFNTEGMYRGCIDQKGMVTLIR